MCDVIRKIECGKYRKNENFEMSVVNKNEEIYNPFEHRKVEKPISEIRATANLIKSSLGSGVLAGPLAFANAGWGIGIIGTILMGILCGHCIHIFVTTSRKCCRLEKKPSLDYPQTVKITFLNGPRIVRPFARTASIVAEFAQVCTYVGICCVYTVFIADSTKQLIDRFIPTFLLPAEYYYLMLLLPTCLICQIRYLKWIAILSLTANILLFSTYLICLWYIFGEKITLTDKQVVGNPARYPIFLSTVIFAMEGVGVVMPIENEMKRPKNFTGCLSVLSVAMSIIVFLYATLGMFGYFRYGDALRGSITLNLPIDDWPALCAKIFIVTSMFFTFPLQYFVAYDTFRKYTAPYIKDNYKMSFEVVARTIGVCFCVGVGLALPLLEQIINLVGSMFFSVLGLMIPAIVETVFKYEHLGRFCWVFWKNLFIFCFGLLTCVSGCTVTVMDILVILKERNK